MQILTLPLPLKSEGQAEKCNTTRVYIFSNTVNGGLTRTPSSKRELGHPCVNGEEVVRGGSGSGPKTDCCWDSLPACWGFDTDICECAPNNPKWSIDQLVLGAIVKITRKAQWCSVPTAATPCDSHFRKLLKHYKNTILGLSHLVLKVIWVIWQNRMVKQN